MIIALINNKAHLKVVASLNTWAVKKMEGEAESGVYLDVF